ncbi:MAG: histidinol dehydrogenase, partial [Verrucomicrobiales bacterium]|nr:histidinol dehydrogenase [Verrucomicrobiales bacterium]
MLRIVHSTDRAALAQLFARRRQRLEKAEGVVAPILEAVRKRGDHALLRYARKFDALAADSVRVPPGELRLAAAGLSPELRKALKTASARIAGFARLQMPRSWTKRLEGGIRLGQIVRP